MGVKDLLGLGKKEKTPFKIPREISDFRSGIDTETRENYPRLDYYEKLIGEAKSVYARLNDIISQQEYAADATRVRDDIRKKLEGLHTKISKSVQEYKKERDDDYVEKNIDYLERKSMRDGAKTVFTAFLNELDSFKKFAEDKKLEYGKTIESEAANFLRTMSQLDTVFQAHGNDRDIRVLNEEMTRKLADLQKIFKEHEARFREKGIAANIEAGLKRMRGA